MSEGKQEVVTARPIRPATDTLSKLRKGRVMDELSRHLYEAVGAVRAIGKPAEVTLKVKIKPFHQKGVVLVEPVLTFEGKVTSKLPEAEAQVTVMYVDEDGNPTTQQPREDQGSLGLVVGGNRDHG